MKTDHITGGFTVIIPLIYVWYCYSICVCSLWTISKVVEPNFSGKKGSKVIKPKLQSERGHVLLLTSDKQ